MLTDGPRVAAFSSRFLRHTKGRWANTPLVYEPWQLEFLDEAFEIDEATGLRVYQEVLLGIPRKNGKSTIASGIGLYLLTSDGEEGPEVYVAAAAKEQARVVFNQQKAFVDSSPDLLDVIRPRQYHLECPGNRGILRVLSSDGALQHGLNPHGNIIDELHAHKGPDLYEALTSGSGAREQPITVTITTAGFDPEQILGVLYNAALEKAGMIERRPGLTIVRDRASGFLMFWYAADEDDDVDDPATWLRANPATWITEDYLRKQRFKPGSRLSTFERLHLNRWTGVEELWLPPGAWGACKEIGAADAKDPLAIFNPRWPVAVAIDFGVSDDTTAVAIAQRVPMPQGRRNPEVPHPEDLVRIRTKFFTPDPAAGEEADVAAVLDYLRALRVRFPAPMRKPDRAFPGGPVFLYDPWGFKALAQILENEGLVMEEVPQTDARMVPASTDLYALTTTKRLRHDGDPVLARHIANVVGKPRGESGWRISKLKNSNTKKIDGAVASAMASSAALRPWPAERVRAFVA